MPDPIEVTFPVSIRLDPSVAESTMALGEIADALQAVVEDAALYGDDDPAGRPARPAESLRSLTPEDNGCGAFQVRVGAPTVALRDWNLAQPISDASLERFVAASSAPCDHPSCYDEHGHTDGCLLSPEP